MTEMMSLVGSVRGVYETGGRPHRKLKIPLSRLWSYTESVNGKEIWKDNNGAPEKSQTFWGEAEQRNERTFAACGKTSDM